MNELCDWQGCLANARWLVYEQNLHRNRNGRMVSDPLPLPEGFALCGTHRGLAEQRQRAQSRYGLIIRQLGCPL